MVKQTLRVVWVAMQGCAYYIEKAQQGDRRALAEAFKLVEAMARAYVFKRIANRQDVEDILQDAYLIACRNLGNLRNPAAFPAWFQAILSTSVYQALRDMQRRPAQLSDMDLLPSLDPNPCDVAVRHQTRRAVLEILASLNGQDREACILRYVHGRPYKEIAKTLGISLGSLKRRLHAARESIIRKYRKDRQRVIRVGYMPISDHLLPMVSHARHMAEGYEVHLQRFMSWASLVKAMANGLVDAAFVMAPIAMSLHNQGMDILYVLDGHHDGSALTISSADGRRPKGKVGLPYIVSTHAAILKLHMSHDGDGDSWGGLAYVNPSYALQSLRLGRISSFFCSEPWSAISVAEGSGRVVARSRDMAPGHMCCGLTVRKAFAEKHPDLVKQYVDSLLWARDAVQADATASGRIQESYTGVPAGIASAVLEQEHISFNDLKPSMDRAEQAMSLSLAAGVLSRPCALDNLINTGFA